MNKQYNVINAHAQALRGICEDAALGRIPFFDYTIDYLNYFGQQAPESPPALIRHLETCEKIGDSAEARSWIESIYRMHSLEVPIGLMDLPIWWAPALVTSIEEINWVQPDHVRTQAVFGWDMVFLQGSYLEIRYDRPLPSEDEQWHIIGGELLNLHRRLEPGPFTPPGRLVEFI